MEKEQQVRRELPKSRTRLEGTLIRVGCDYQILLQGGEQSHIGCTVMAVPRKSLKKDGGESCTSSVLNVLGHKDEEICRYLAEKVASETGRIVVCTGGIHIDGITGEQLEEIRQAAEELGAELVRVIQSQCHVYGC